MKLFDLVKQNKIVTIIVVIIVAVIVFFIVKKIKAWIKKPKEVPLPTGGSGLPVTGTNQLGQPVYWNPDGISKKLFETMDGVTDSTSSKEEAWNEFSKLPTDDMKVMVYNHFNKVYGKGDSLRTWINDEVYIPLLGTNYKDRIISELDRLQLA